VSKQVPGEAVEEIKFPNPKPRVFLSNPFGDEVLDTREVESLCVRSLKGPSP
jgi:hypothetical protein